MGNNRCQWWSPPIQSEMTLVPPISICIMLDHSDDPFRSNPRWCPERTKKGLWKGHFDSPKIKSAFTRISVPS